MRGTISASMAALLKRVVYWDVMGRTATAALRSGPSRCRYLDADGLGGNDRHAGVDGGARLDDNLGADGLLRNVLDEAGVGGDAVHHVVDPREEQRVGKVKRPRGPGGLVEDLLGCRELVAVDLVGDADRVDLLEGAFERDGVATGVRVEVHDNLLRDALVGLQQR